MAGCCEHVQVRKVQEASSLGQDLLSCLEVFCFMESFVWLVLEGLVAMLHIFDPLLLLNSDQSIAISFKPTACYPLIF